MDLRTLGTSASNAANQFDASRARFLQSRDHLANTRNEEVGLNVSKHLENISTVAQISMGIVQDALG